MDNPFEMILERLDRIEKAIEDLTLRNIPIVEKISMGSCEVAKYLHLSVPTIYGLCHRNKIPYYKVGKRLFFKKEEIDDWINSGRRISKPEIIAKADLYLSKNRLY